MSLRAAAAWTSRWVSTPPVIVAGMPLLGSWWRAGAGPRPSAKLAARARRLGCGSARNTDLTDALSVAPVAIPDAMLSVVAATSEVRLLTQRRSEVTSARLVVPSGCPGQAEVSLHDNPSNRARQPEFVGSDLDRAITRSSGLPHRPGGECRVSILIAGPLRHPRDLSTREPPSRKQRDSSPMTAGHRSLHARPRSERRNHPRPLRRSRPRRP